MRIRITYQKNGALRYTSTLDVQTIWERSVRRAGLMLQYSQGFHPLPRIQIANPLPLGFIGENELIDIWLVEDYDTNDVISYLNSALPAGMQVTAAESIEENGPSLPKQIDASVYRVDILDEKYNLAQIIDQIAQILSKESLPRVRNKKSYDLRPLIQSLEVRQNGQNQLEITAKMPSNSSQTGRPEEIMAEMGIPLEDFRITRIQLVFLEKYRDSHS